MNICIVIPVHNEASQIGRIVQGIKQLGHDVVVIDDGSTDRSGDVAREHGAAVIRNEEKNGKGASLQRGFAHVIEHRYDGLITMDGDGQHAVEDIRHFTAEILRSPQTVITGNRMGDTRGMPWIRCWTNRLMSALISRICRQHIPDTQCGYRYVSGEILRRLRLTSRDFEIETEVLIQASRKGYKILSVPIQTIYRNEKSKINPLKDTIRFFAYLLKASLRHRSDG